MAPEGRRNVNWNDFKKVLRAIDEHVTENAYEHGRRWVPERETAPVTTRRSAAPKKSPNAALAR